MITTLPTTHPRILEIGERLEETQVQRCEVCKGQLSAHNVADPLRTVISLTPSKKGTQMQATKTPAAHHNGNPHNANNTKTLPTVFTGAQVDFLQQRTPSQAIRTRPGRGGQQLSYISQAYVTRTLNEIFGFDWDFDVLWQEIGKAEVIVRGQLTVRTPTGVTISKTQYGGSAIKRTKDGKALSVADDLKAAASDALKKCASLLGIGLDLYYGG